MNKIPCLFIIIFIISGCQSLPTEEQNPSSGGYYLDDGPDKSIPENLDGIADAIPKIETLYKRASKPYKAFKKIYAPMKKLQPYKTQGYASWYGKKYHGNKTSIGEVYDMYKMTAAHKTLPLPCFVRVTNLKNGRSIVVRVNDRGPFVKDRIIDLSYVAAHQLRIIEKGSELVQVELIDPTQVQESYKAKFFIQAGAFSNKQNAEKMLKKLNEIKINNKIKAKREIKGSLHQVLIGPFSSYEAAEIGLNKFNGKIKINSFIIKN
jgi:rare lipoprotein A